MASIDAKTIVKGYVIACGIMGSIYGVANSYIYSVRISKQYPIDILPGFDTITSPFMLAAPVTAIVGSFFGGLMGMMAPVLIPGYFLSQWLMNYDSSRINN